MAFTFLALKISRYGGRDQCRGLAARGLRRPGGVLRALRHRLRGELGLQSSCGGLGDSAALGTWAIENTWGWVKTYGDYHLLDICWYILVTKPLKLHEITSSTAQGDGGSFKNRKPVGEIGCCESGMAERIHWWTERCLRSPLFLSLSLTIYFPTNLSSMYLFIYLSIYLSIDLSIYLSIDLYFYLFIYLSIFLSFFLICLIIFSLYL